MRLKSNRLILYVSTNGNDGWSGHLPKSNAAKSDGPFATIMRAQMELRKIFGGCVPLYDLVKVLIRGGNYELKETLVFSPEDSGSDKVPIIYAAYPGERPVFSGGRIIGDWKVEELNGNRLWTVHLPEVAEGKWSFSQLFVNGVRRQRARLPKNGWYRFTGLPEGCRGIHRGAPSANYASGDLDPAWNWKDIDLIAMECWFESHLRVKLIDQETRTVHFVVPAISHLYYEKKEYARYYVENVLEAISEPGEWCLDSSTGKLCYLPEPGEELNNVEIIAPRLEKLLLLAGNASGGKVRNLRFENLDFRHAEWRLPFENSGASQAACNVPGAIIFRATENCVLYGCAISRIGQYAVEVQKGSFSNRIAACSLYDLGAGGIKINHEGPITSTKYFEGIDIEAEGWGRLSDEVGPIPGRDLTGGMHTTVVDCEISHGGRMFPSAVGIWIGDSGRNRILHNHIYDLYYSGISCGWNWGGYPTHCKDNLIEYNHIHDIGQGVLSDMGGIYLLGRQPGTIVRGNHIHDVRSYDGHGGNGLYNDESSSYTIMEGNLVHHVECGYHCNYGCDLMLQDNIFAMTGKCLLRIGEAGRLKVNRNIMLSANAIFTGYSYNNGVDADCNIYWIPTDVAKAWNGISPEAWLNMDIDRHAVFCDPLFINPDTGDFRIRADSPIRKRKELFEWMKAGIRYMPDAVLLPSLDAWNCRMKDKDRLDCVIIEPWFNIKMEKSGHKGTLFMHSGQNECINLELTNHGNFQVAGDAEISLPKSLTLVDGSLVKHYDMEPRSRNILTWTVIAKRAVMIPLTVIVKSRQNHFMPTTQRILTEMPSAVELGKMVLQELNRKDKVMLSMGTAWYDSTESRGKWLPGAGFWSSKYGMADRGLIPIHGTGLPRIYQTEAYANPDRNMICQIPLSNGKYEISFHFAETILQVKKGIRKFDIVINGKLWQRNIDVFAQAGGAFKALVLTTNEPISVNNGIITIEITSDKSGSAMINGLEFKRAREL